MLELETGTKFIYRQSSLGIITKIEDGTVWFELISRADFSWRTLLISSSTPQAAASPHQLRGAVSTSIPTDTLLNHEDICTPASALQGFSEAFFSAIDSDPLANVIGVDHNKIGSTEGNLSIRLKSHLRDLDYGRFQNLGDVANKVIDFIVQREASRLKRKGANSNRLFKALLDGQGDIWERLLLGSPITTRNIVRDVLIEASLLIAVEQCIPVDAARKAVCEKAVQRVHRMSNLILEDASVMS